MQNKLHRSNIIIGCEPLGGVDWGNYDINETIKAISGAVNIGYEYFDTADVYGLGKSEVRLGKIIQNHHNRINVLTKCGVRWFVKEQSQRAYTTVDLSLNYIKSAINNSFVRLNLSNLHTIFLHWPPKNIDDMKEIILTLHYLKDLKEEKRIKCVGLSNFDKSILCKLPIDLLPDCIQFKNSLVNPNYQMMEYCNENNVQSITYGVLEHGLLSGNYKKSYSFDNKDRRSRIEFQKILSSDKFDKVLKLVKNLSHELNISNTQAAILLTKDTYCPSKIIIGIKSITQLEELNAITR